MARHTARERALQFLFECEMHCENIADQKAQFLLLQEKLSDENMKFFDELVYGVIANKEELDSMYAPYLRKWTPDRLPIVDRCIFRLALYEIIHGTVPASVAISEAIQLANTYAEEEAYIYVNGVLGALVRDKELD
ncbi:MAG: transcription antitermination factor NusB [Fastidiosipila sp.]|nr:transcription antitermination factor NusB [Fastidiosipila sp.]